MVIRRWLAFVLSVLAVGGAWGKGKDITAPPSGPGFTLLERVGSDPLLVWAMRAEDLGRDLDGITGMFAKFLPEAERGKIDAGLKQLDERLGMSFRSDFLSQLGPEVVVVLDLPPLDNLIGQMSGGRPESVAGALSGVGVLAGVRDPVRFERALRRLLELGHATIQESDGIAEASFAEAPVKLRWSIRERVLVFGLSAEWIASASTARVAGTRAIDGRDFVRVVTNLDARPATLLYVNLPKAARMVRESQFVQAMLQANPDAARAVEAFLAPEMTGVGLGYTSVRLGEGTRTSSFGPSWMSSGGMMAGIVAAVALPNLLTAMDRAKQKRTMADLEAAGLTLAAYAIDHQDRYPTSEGWQSLGAVLDGLPEKDGWGHSFEYWSDGSRYVLVSRGKDGETERDWRNHEGLGGARPAFEADIVFADGKLVAWPGVQDADE